MSIPLHVTPPESVCSSPITPPPTDEKKTLVIPRIVEEIKSRKDGQNRNIEPWIGFTLDAKEHDELRKLLRSEITLHGFVRDKLRYESADHKYTIS
jgi:hypothetical protein